MRVQLPGRWSVLHCCLAGAHQVQLVLGVPVTTAGPQQRPPQHAEQQQQLLLWLTVGWPQGTSSGGVAAAAGDASLSTVCCYDTAWADTPACLVVLPPSVIGSRRGLPGLWQLAAAGSSSGELLLLGLLQQQHSAGDALGSSSSNGSSNCRSTACKLLSSVQLSGGVCQVAHLPQVRVGGCRLHCMTCGCEATSQQCRYLHVKVWCMQLAAWCAAGI